MQRVVALCDDFMSHCCECAPRRIWQRNKDIHPYAPDTITTEWKWSIIYVRSPRTRTHFASLILHTKPELADTIDVSISLQFSLSFPYRIPIFSSFHIDPCGLSLAIIHASSLRRCRRLLWSPLFPTCMGESLSISLMTSFRCSLERPVVPLLLTIWTEYLAFPVNR